MGKMKEIYSTELSNLEFEKKDLLKAINNCSLELFNLQEKLKRVLSSIEVKKSYLASEGENE